MTTETDSKSKEVEFKLGSYKTSPRVNFVTVNNFLAQQTADDCYKFFSTDMPREWWELIVFNKEFLSVRNEDDNYEQYQEAWQEGSEALSNDGLAFRFLRGADHYKTCKCIKCNLDTFLASDQVMSLVNKNLETQVKTFEGSYISCYKPGCYLSTHNDEGRGKVGFIYCLTKNWLPQWGGNIHFITDSKTITSTVTPQFNQLILFKLSQDNSRFISQVSSDIKQSAFYLCGWYS